MHRPPDAHPPRPVVRGEHKRPGGKLTRKATSARKVVKAPPCAVVVNGQRCGGGVMPGSSLCGPHHQREQRGPDALTAQPATEFGTPGSPVTVRLVETRQPTELRDLLAGVQHDIDRGRARTSRWVRRVKTAAAKRDTAAVKAGKPTAAKRREVLLVEMQRRLDGH